MAIKTEYKIAAVWIGIVLLQFARLINIEIPYSFEIVGVLLILVWTIFFMQNGIEFERSQLIQKQENELLRQEAKLLTESIEKLRKNFQIFSEQLASLNTEKVTLTETIADLLRDQKKAQNKKEHLIAQKRKIELEHKELMDRHNLLQKLLIQFIPKSKTGAPFGLPIKKKSEWLKWQKAYSIISPLRKQNYTWEQIKAKISIIDNRLPTDRSTLKNIENTGSFGLLEQWPPDISLFVDFVP